MYNLSPTSFIKLFYFSLALGLVGAGPAMARCYGPLPQLPASVLDSFNSTPEDVLKLNKEQLTSQVRDLVTSSAPTLQVIALLLKAATAEQTSAIGTGLAQAAMICVRTDQQFATKIQAIVAASGNLALNEAVSSSLGDKPTADVFAQRVRAKRSIYKGVQRASIVAPLKLRKHDQPVISAR